MFADVIEFHTLAVPSGIPAYQVSEIYFFFLYFFLHTIAPLCWVGVFGWGFEFRFGVWGFKFMGLGAFGVSLLRFFGLGFFI